MSTGSSRAVALVTGGNRGIGLAISESLSHQGCHVAIGCRDVDRGREAASNIPNSRVFQLDVTDDASIQRCIGNIQREWGRLDSLINNAALVQTPAYIEDVTEAEWDRVFATNLKGAFLVTRAVVSIMKERRHGRIINISSIGARSTRVPVIAYAASKGGLLSFTKLLAMELAEFNISVNAVMPGPTETDMWKQAVPTDQQERISQTIPMKRPGRPEEIAALVAFLNSNQSGYITGECITISGGLPGLSLAGAADSLE